MKILITGGAGFIGSHLTDELLDKGHRVVVMDNLRNGKLENLEYAFKSDKFHFIKEDILNAGACYDIVEQHGIDVIYHLACLGVRHSLHSPFENHKVNAEGTLNMLEAARRFQIKKFIYISTSEVYGDVSVFPIHENAAPLPKTIYGSSKLAGENYTYSYHKCYGLDVVIFRIFNNYGPRAHYEGDAGELIPRSIVHLLYNHPPVIFGDGSVTRDFFYVKDTARILAQWLDISGYSGEIFNLGTGEEITIKEVVNTITRLMKKNIPPRYIESRPADVPRLWVDNAKISKIINPLSTTSFEEGLLQTISYYESLMNKKNLLEEITVKNWSKS
ncbi:MAG: GDP-mannose 4,6-dehydratase [Bacteroidia bacterium]|nr:GDP-mannose 4,6-dehydratase [Bacteroidia bacterium]